MAAASNGVRLGALIDRDQVAERIAARSAPLPERPPAAVPGAGSRNGLAGFVLEQVDLGAVEAARRTDELDHVAFVGRAVVDAARALPAANGGSRTVHLGIDGRIVRDADRLRLAALAEAIEGATDHDTDATIAITTTDAGAAVAPPPGTAAVVALGRVEVRPVARPGPDGEWAIVLRPVADLTVTFDPDRLTAADAAALAGHVRRALEERDWQAGHQ